MAFDLKAELGQNMVVTLVIPNEIYVSNITEIAKQLAANHNKICYISLNKLYQPLIRNLKAHEVDINKFFFVDGITRTAVVDPGQVENCVFVSSPSSLTELGITIQKTVSEQQSEAVLFDSLSTLLVYEDIQVVKQFVHLIVSQISATNCVAIFTCLEGDKESELIKDLSMFVDKVIHLKE